MNTLQITTECVGPSLHEANWVVIALLSITRKIDAMVQKRSLTVLKTIENFGWIGRSCPKSFGVLGA